MTLSISVGKLRQNPTEAFDEVEAGREVVVTRNNKEIAKLVPSSPRKRVTPEMARAFYESTPLRDDSWLREIEDMRDANTVRDVFGDAE